MLVQTRRTQPCRYVEERRTWIWSDLHLHHRNIIRYCARPYDSVEQMNQALYAAWERLVQPDDVVICGGDVALSGSMNSKRLARVLALPGRKLVVMGNHDLKRPGRLNPTGFVETSMTMLIEHGTPLLLTHIPLDEVPAGCVHGHVYVHVHNNVPLGRTRHINIAWSTPATNPCAWKQSGCWPTGWWTARRRRARRRSRGSAGQEPHESGSDPRSGASTGIKAEQQYPDECSGTERCTVGGPASQNRRTITMERFEPA